MLRRLALLGLILGLLGGVIAAIAIPERRADAADARAGAAEPSAPAGVVRVAPARALPRDAGYIRLRLRGAARIEARGKDPLGGPDWAVRVFVADRVADGRAIGRSLCAQVGRLHEGTFGWLDATGTFRRVPFDLRGAPATCGSRRADVGGQATFYAFNTITEPEAPTARRRATVVWGLAGAAARRIVVRLGSRAVTRPRSAHGAYLAVGPATDDPVAARADIRYPNRRVILPRPRPRSGSIGISLPTARRGKLAARAPDPNGGLPYGLLVSHSPDGRWCSRVGARVVDDRAGTVDYALDTFDQLQVAGGGGCSGALTARDWRRTPVVLNQMSGGGLPGEPGEDPGTSGRVTRRTQPGITLLGGVAAPGVVAVTLETPRDVRTLTPTGPARAILAAYDGSFTTGTIRVVARFRDGRTHTQTIEAGL